MKKIFFIFVCILCAFSSGCFADTSKSKPDWKKDRFFHEEFFQRDYTLEHLAQNPSQRVKKIIISIWYLPKKAEIARKHFGFENDPDDNKFTDCVIASNANFLVTNDKHFNILNTVEFPKVDFISAEKFLKTIKN